MGPPSPTSPTAPCSAAGTAAEPRDYQAEIEFLLRQRRALQAEMREMDLDQAVSDALASVAAESRRALASCESSAQRAHDRIKSAHEQYKAQPAASRISRATVESEVDWLEPPSSSANKDSTGDEYTDIMVARPKLQQGRGITGGT